MLKKQLCGRIHGHILDSANLGISCISALPADTIFSALTGDNCSIRVTGTEAFTPHVLTNRLLMPEASKLQHNFSFTF